MDTRPLENQLVKILQRALGRGVEVARGPMTPTLTGGIIPEVNLHTARFEDVVDVGRSSPSLSRAPVKGPGTARGFSELRAARITLAVACRSGSYDIAQEIAKTVTPAVLLGLAQIRDFELGELPNATAQVHFENAGSFLASAHFVAEGEGSNACFRGTLEFQLDGFVRIRLARRGGFGRKTLPVSDGKKKRKSGKKAAAKKKAVRKKT